MAKDHVSIYCPHCRQKTAVSVAPVEGQDRFGAMGRLEHFSTAAVWKRDKNDIWWIGLCNHCDSPVLVHNDGDIVYPFPIPQPSDINIPEEIRSDLDEAKRCVQVQAYRGCAVLARRAIQNACLEKGAAKGNLVGQIKELEAKGIITKDLSEWATVVRWVGNDGAHPSTDKVESEDAEDILALAEQFLQVLYVTPAIAKSQRTKKGK
jgi:hypothetical protein